MIRILHEELLTELKKKAAEICGIQNVLPGHMTQEGDTNQLHVTDQIRGNMEICHITQMMIKFN